MQQARAAAAAQQAKAAAAEQARLENERELDGLQQAAVAAAVAKYKQDMSALAQNSTSEADVRSKHQVRLCANASQLESVASYYAGLSLTAPVPCMMIAEV
jgi:hypothetical protein